MRVLGRSVLLTPRSRSGLASSAVSATGVGLARSARLAAALLTVLAAVGSTPPALARTSVDNLPTVSLSTLPGEAQKTKRLILSGGPFPYEKDGTVFFNRERLLPSRPRGDYREYTVRTPGVSHRGARRIVCGGQPPTTPDACYYTADHYASFRRIVVDR